MNLSFFHHGKQIGCSDHLSLAGLQTWNSTFALAAGEKQEHFLVRYDVQLMLPTWYQKRSGIDVRPCPSIRRRSYYFHNCHRGRRWAIRKHVAALIAQPISTPRKQPLLVDNHGSQTTPLMNSIPELLRNQQIKDLRSFISTSIFGFPTAAPLLQYKDSPQR